MKRIVIISSGYFPVPAVKGGAVETLIEKIAISNDLYDVFELTIYSTFDVQAKKIASTYKNTKVEYIKDKWIVEHIDLTIYALAKKIIKSDRQMSFRYIMHRIAYIFEVAKQLKAYNYDYLIIENTATLFWCLRLFGNSKRYRNRYIYHLHNIIGSTFGCKKLICQSKKIIGVSDFVNLTIKKKFPEIDNKKFSVLYNTIDIEKIQKQKESREGIRRKFGFLDSDIVVVFVGRLCKDKGIRELLEAFAKIEQENIKLLIVGNFYFGTNLESAFEKHLYDLIERKEEKIVFTGFVTNSEIGKYYCCADIAALPSVWEEPAGLTIIEAMAASLPIITTNSGGIPEYVGNDNAIIIDSKSKNFIFELRQEIVKLSNNVQKREELGNRAFERVRRFDSLDYAEKLGKILDE